VASRRLPDEFILIVNVDPVTQPNRPANPDRKIRVAILFQRFGPYHHARLNAAGQAFSVWGVEACAMEETYAWDKVEGAAAFTRVTLTDRDSGGRRWKRELHQKMWRALEDIKPDVVVVPGWSYADALSALLWCAKNNTPSVVMSESTAWDEARVGWKEWLKCRLVKLNSAALAGGTPHTDYLVQLGLERERIFSGYDIVDNEYFSRHADAARGQGAPVRRQHGVPEKYFLASARFIEKKNLFRLLQAYRAYRDRAGKMEEGKPESAIWDLVLLGDGPLKLELNRLVSELGLESCVHRPGFKQYQELPAYFGLARAFVHPSTTEQWGLVVNEAMAAGLPVLVSNRCGCAADLVAEGVNGFTFAPENVEQLTQLLRRVSSSEFPIADFGTASRRIISGWGPEKFAEGLRAAVAVALKHPRPRAGLPDRLLLNLLLRR
jgi:glycosyltransferase involved in cell wall biosynthesis